jgi:hypothetical protein
MHYFLISKAPEMGAIGKPWQSLRPGCPSKCKIRYKNLDLLFTFNLVKNK